VPERPSTTRRRFVLDTLGGLAGAAWVAACGSRGELARSASGTGGAASGAGGGETDSGTPSTHAGGSSGAGTSTGGAGASRAGGAGGDGAGGGGGTSAPDGATSGAGGVGNASDGAAGSDSGTCALYPQETQGPYYLDLGLVRSDITEGKPGAPLELEIQVVRASGCAPVKDAVVDVWHCDAAGVYTGFPGQLGGLDTTGQKALRGTQVTDGDGTVVFKTIYPGWYPGRTTHIHFKVHLSATTEVTSQLYFPEEITATVYRSAPYDAHGQKDTSNAADATAHTGGMPPLLGVTSTGAGFVAKMVVTVLG